MNAKPGHTSRRNGALVSSGNCNVIVFYIKKDMFCLCSRWRYSLQLDRCHPGSMDQFLFHVDKLDLIYLADDSFCPMVMNVTQSIRDNTLMPVYVLSYQSSS